MTEPLKPKPLSIAFTNEERALMAAKAPDDAMRTLSQKVKTAVLNIFQYSPSLFDPRYIKEQRTIILNIVNAINALTLAPFPPSEEKAVQQHIFALLAKNLAYRDFSCLTPPMLKHLAINIPVEGKIIPYHFFKSVTLTNFCDSHILVAENAPPLILVPGTCTRWDSPGKLWETVGANLQGSTWKPVADGFMRVLVPEISRLRNSQISAYIIGHSAGASAIRQVLSRHASLAPHDRETLLAARFHSFNPPATSPMRAKAIDEIPEQKENPIFTTYLEAHDPISHMSGTTHAGHILISPPDERSIVASHTDSPLPRRINGLLVTPYSSEYREEWSLNRILSQVTISLIALINILGINAALSTMKPVIKSLILIFSRMISAAIYLSIAAFYHKPEALKLGKQDLEGFGKSVLHFSLHTIMIPFRFLYTYWNKIIAPAIYCTTGRELYLSSYKLDMIGL